MSMPSRFAAGLPTVAPEVLDRMVSDRGAECPYCGCPAGLKSPVCDRSSAGIPASVSLIGPFTTRLISAIRLAAPRVGRCDRRFGWACRIHRRSQVSATIGYEPIPFGFAGLRNCPLRAGAP